MAVPRRLKIIVDFKFKRVKGVTTQDGMEAMDDIKRYIKRRLRKLQTIEVEKISTERTDEERA